MSGGKVWVFSVYLLVLVFLGITLPEREAVDSKNRFQEWKICEIQGDGFSSPLHGDFVQTEGIVTADLDVTNQEGFTIQHQNCDGDPLTSDGIFVYLGEKLDVVDTGHHVLVAGEVEEAFGLTRIEATPENVAILSSENAPSAPVAFHPPFDNQKSRLYFESHESMKVSVEEALVVGPTNQLDETWLIRSDLGLERVFHDDSAGTGELIKVGDDGLYGVHPGAKVGDRIQNLEGIVDFSLGTFQLLLLSPPILLPEERSDISEHESKSPGDFSIATFNLKDLFDTSDDPDLKDSVLSPSEYRAKLKKLALAIRDGLTRPVLIAVQEAESAETLQALVNRPEINDDDYYEFTLVDGPDARGLDIALLYHHSRVEVVQAESPQGCTSLIDGLGPDGNLDLENPDNTNTCDTNGDGDLDGNRLFSRPPLVVRVRVCEVICARESDHQLSRERDLWLIINHWRSKRHDSNDKPYSLPRRLEQAEFVAQLAEEIDIGERGASLVVLGDFNDTEDSEPLSRLRESGLVNLTSRIPRANRYTYIYQGISQTLDHILVSAGLSTRSALGLFIQTVPINTDYPDYFRSDEGTYLRSSDHDPVLLRFVSIDHFLYLPFLGR